MIGPEIEGIGKCFVSFDCGWGLRHVSSGCSFQSRQDQHVISRQLDAAVRPPDIPKRNVESLSYHKQAAAVDGGATGRHYVKHVHRSTKRSAMFSLLFTPSFCTRHVTRNAQI
jgi:hypothetical protein